LDGYIEGKDLYLLAYENGYLAYMEGRRRALYMDWITALVTDGV
jgi:hypothetical protein